jgi:hypothetical protein
MSTLVILDRASGDGCGAASVDTACRGSQTARSSRRCNDAEAPAVAKSSRRVIRRPDSEDWLVTVKPRSKRCFALCSPGEQLAQAWLLVPLTLHGVLRYAPDENLRKMMLHSLHRRHLFQRIRKLFLFLLAVA